MAMRGRGAGRGIPSRPPRLIVNRVYEEFKPMSEWRQEDDHDILLVYLPGFQKEYIKVTTEDVNIVRVRGERLVSENKWSRFQEDYRVPENCEMRGIRAKFDGGILTITMPRKITSEPPPPPTTATTSRVAPKTKEQPFGITKQEETIRKPEEPKAMPRKITSAPPPPPLLPTMTRVAPKTKEQPFRQTKQEQTIRKPEEPKEKKPDKPQTAPLEHNTLPPPPPTTATTSRVAPKTKEQPFGITKQEETIRKPEEPKAMPRKITSAPPPPPLLPTMTWVAPKTKEQPFRQTKQEQTIRKPEEPKEKKPDKPQTAPLEHNTLPAPPKPTSSSAPTKQPPPKPKEMPRKITSAPPPPPPLPTTTRVAPKTEEQPFRQTKQEETIRKPEEPKEKKPDKPQTAPLENNTLPAPPKPTSSSAPTKQPPSKPAPQAKEAVEFTTGTLPRGRFEHDVVEKPGIGKKTDLDKGKGKEATLEEETKRDFEGKPSSSGFGGGFRAGLEKVVAGRGMINEDRTLLVNVGVGVLIIAALGVHVSYTIGLIGKEK